MMTSFNCQRADLKESEMDDATHAFQLIICVLIYLLTYVYSLKVYHAIQI